MERTLCLMLALDHESDDHEITEGSDSTSNTGDKEEEDIFADVMKDSAHLDEVWMKELSTRP